MAAGREAMAKLCSPPDPVEAATLLSLPDDCLAALLKHLSQKQRAAAALVCRRLRGVCQSAAALWESVELQLSLSDPRALERTEGFLAFLIPRAAAVHKLAIAAERGGSAAAAAAAAESSSSGPLPHLTAAHLSLVFSNLVSALTLMGASLKHLCIDWPDDLQLSQWLGTLVALESGSFTAPRITVRPGLGSLPRLKDLRFRSTKKPLAFASSHGSPGRHGHSSAAAAGALGVPLLPPHLLKLRLEGCHLTELPASLGRLTCLEDLVLSDNNLQAARLSVLSRLASLQSLTLMGCSMSSLPPALSALTNLRVLYLDMGIQAPAGPDAPPMHRQCDLLLGPLERLAILSMGACHLQAFPSELVAHTALRALYLDDNSLTSLPVGPYLEQLRVLGIDWRVLFNSHGVLRHAPHLSKLCLMSMGKLELEAAMSSEADVAAVVASLTLHPSLRQVLLPSLDGLRSQLYIAALNVLIGISRAQHLEVRACSYNNIGNEWLDWLHTNGW